MCAYVSASYTAQPTILSAVEQLKKHPPPPGQKVTCSAAPAAALLAEKQLRIMLRLLGRLIIGADCENEGFSQIHCYLQLLSILTY